MLRFTFDMLTTFSLRYFQITWYSWITSHAYFNSAQKNEYKRAQSVSERMNVIIEGLLQTW